jgi:hypothetical protein
MFFFFFFFGIVGRSTSSQAGEFNGTNSQVFHEGGGAVVTAEWCFTSLNCIFTTPGDSGDSGSVIFDQDYYPVAIVWGGSQASKIGGVTCTTPIGEILRDIERRQNWVKGSVTIC